MPADTPPVAHDELDRASLVIMAGVALLFLAKAFLALNSVFEADEFDAFAMGRQLLDDPGARLMHVHRLLSAALFALGAAVGQQDPVVGMITNRAIAVVVCALIYLEVLRIAGRTFGTLAGIHALVGLGLVHVFIDHTFTARADLFTLAAFVATLDLMLTRRRWAAVLSGVTLGLALFTSMKAVLAIGAIGAGVIALAATDRGARGALRQGLLMAAGFAIPVALYALLRAVAGGDGWSPAQETATRAAAMATAAGEVTSFRGFWWSALRQNPVFFAVALTGLGLVVRRTWRDRGSRRDDTLVVLAVTLAYLLAALAYPQPWPYFIATVIPLLALYWGDLCGAIHRRLLRDREVVVLAGCVAVLAAVGLLRPLDRVRHDHSMRNDYQIAVMDRVGEVLGPRDSYFDGVGMAPACDREVDLWLDAPSLSGFRQDPEATEALIQALTEARTGALIVNERLDGLPEAFQRFRRTWFVQEWGSVFVPGRAYDSADLVGYEAPLPALVEGEYRVRGQDGAWRALLIDGQPLGRAVVRLPRGTHRVTATEDVGAIKILRLGEGFSETRQPLDAYKPLFPKESLLLHH
jgi:hypothetical protein